MASNLLEPLPPTEWDRRKARHLLRRAGFGVPMSRFEALAKMTPAEAVAYFLDFQKHPETIPEPDWLKPAGAEREMRQQMQRMEQMNNASRGVQPDDEDRKAMEAERQKRNMELQREQRQEVEQLKEWWLRRIITTQRPLQEKMTLFWHGHFATSAEKVKSPAVNYQLNKLFRDQAIGNFKLLTYGVCISPAMMRYLDNAQNNRNHPNENWARELMELFTLGQGNYTEEDIKNSARAFTGWATDGEKFVYRPAQHDEDNKKFMGVTGNLNGSDVMDIIFRHPAASRFITTKLWKYFAYDEPEPEVIEGLAATLRQNGFELRPMLEQMFRSRAFYSDKALETQVKSPVELAVSMLSYLDINDVDSDDMVSKYVINSLRVMGQDLFFPPNVKGWPGGRTWISTNTLMTRYNLSNFLVQGVVVNMGGPGGGPAARQLEQMIRQQQRGMQGRGQPGNRGGQPGNRGGPLNNRGGRGAARGRGPNPNAMPGEMAMGSGMDMPGQMGGVGDSNGPKGFQLPNAPFKAKAFFNRAKGVQVQQIADFLADYLYGMPVRDDQRAKVIEALTGGRGGVAAPLDVAQWDEGRLRGAMHLMLSTAEFQVC